MIWPLKEFTLTQRVSPTHIAHDMAAPTGTPVLAPVTGTVIDIGSNPNYIGGLYVIIREDHPDSWEYYTGHHSAILVSPGQRVSEGQVVARIGQTGQATGPHTHFQIRQRNGGNLMHPQFVYENRNGGDKNVDYKANYELLKKERDEVLYPYINDVSDALGIPRKADKGLAQLAIQQYKDKANKPSAAFWRHTSTVSRDAVLAYINERLG